MDDSIRKVLVLGSGALKIGEAGEFDYSGSQALKALREENIEIVLINPNIATIQTSKELADSTYLLPVNPEFVERVIEKERPDGILISFGGQTALNCGLELADRCTLERYGVRILGTPIETIRDTEDRALFVKRLNEISVATPRSKAASSLEHALRIGEEIGYPVMVRIGFALGGLGSGKCENESQLIDRVKRGLAHSPQVLIEEYLQGWKEVEYEVVRDSFDNCITVCNMENFDPLGIHTGESIVVAPSQTLDNTEYHRLREISIRIIRHLGIVGECNIQFAIDPLSGDYRVIEVNARLSRSSALASKATGYPLAYIAAKLALGKNLAELKNSVTQSTTACFEPALDYVVVKIPRWDLKKFKQVSMEIGSQMKSVGEVMGIGRNFEEALQKAVRMLDISADGVVGWRYPRCEKLAEQLTQPDADRLFVIPHALREGYSVDEVYRLTHIDRWFLQRINYLVEIECELGSYSSSTLPAELLREAKRLGFSDRQLASVLNCVEEDVRAKREVLNLHPFIKQIDTLAAEYPAPTNYLYCTYDADEHDVDPVGNNSILILGSGAYRIGSSVEFDWCCVNAAQAVRRLGYSTLLLNCNPETVSTDYDTCDRLYFDSIDLETVLYLTQFESCQGVIVSVGGQIANNLALRLHRAGVHVIGTSPIDIDRAEDRHKFSSMLDSIGIEQPPWKEATSLGEVVEFAHSITYPVLLRPSYVLSGSAMGVATNDREVKLFLENATRVSPYHPVVVSKFVENAKEIEVDGVSQEGNIVALVVTEHVENAGVHSGDATLVIPPQRTYLETIRRIKETSERIANRLRITGPFNIQFLAVGNSVKVIECNLRASRSFPFASKTTKINLINLAVRAIMGVEIEKENHSLLNLDYVGVKAPQFSFARLQGADPLLGVEMTSTGEVGCLGDDFDEAFLKALIAVGFRFPLKNVLLSTGPLADKITFVDGARTLFKTGVHLFATQGTAEFLAAQGIETTVVGWPSEDKRPNAGEMIEAKQFDLVVNIPKNFQESELTNDYLIRRRSVDFGIPLITNIQLANRLAEALAHDALSNLQVKPLQAY